MKIFHKTQKQYEILGISPSNQWIQNDPFSKRVIFGCLLFGPNLISQFVYLFHVANGFIECVICICSITATIIIFVCFAAVVFRKSKLFESISNVEKFINISKTVCIPDIQNKNKELMYFRVEKSKIGSILLENQSAGRTLE